MSTYEFLAWCNQCLFSHVKLCNCVQCVYSAVLHRCLLKSNIGQERFGELPKPQLFYVKVYVFNLVET